jgi:hypothetical protein
MRKLLTRLLLAAATLMVAIALAVSVPKWVASQIHVRAGLLSLQPKVLPRGLPDSLPSLVFGQIEVSAQVFVRNNTWIDLTLRDVKWRAYLSDRQVAQGTLPQGQKLPYDREEPVQLLAVISATALGLAAAEMLRVRSADIAVEVEGTVAAFGLSVRRTVRLGGFDLRLDAGHLTQLPTALPARLPEPTRKPTGSP